MVSLAKAPALSKSNARAIEIAEQSLLLGNPGAYARAVAALHRASTARQQAAIEETIGINGTAKLFAYRNGCVIARD